MATSNSLIGRVFTRLTVVKQIKNAALFECVCVCGNTTILPRHRLLSGNTKSCGCLKRTVLGDSVRTHGKANSRLTGYANKAYGIWQAMRDRCSNPNRADYPRYGGRGIKVCARWKKFENFYADMGDPPAGLTLDRINNDKGYSPKNCRWASRKAQTHNSTRVRWITIKGQRRMLREWLEYFSISRDVFYKRLKKGYSETEALTAGIKQ